MIVALGARVVRVLMPDFKTLKVNSGFVLTDPEVEFASSLGSRYAGMKQSGTDYRSEQPRRFHVRVESAKNQIIPFAVMLIV